jgi:hypothetical protein
VHDAVADAHGEHRPIVVVHLSMRNACSAASSSRRVSVIGPNATAGHQAEEEAFLATALAWWSVRRSKCSIFSFSARCRHLRMCRPAAINARASVREVRAEWQAVVDGGVVSREIGEAKFFRHLPAALPVRKYLEANHVTPTELAARARISERTLSDLLKRARTTRHAWVELARAMRIRSRNYCRLSDHSEPQLLVFLDCGRIVGMRKLSVVRRTCPY